MEDNKVIGAREFAKLTGQNVFTVYEHLRRGIVPHHRFGRAVKFTPEDVREYLDMTRVPARS